MAVESLYVEPEKDAARSSGRRSSASTSSRSTAPARSRRSPCAGSTCASSAASWSPCSGPRAAASPRCWRSPRASTSRRPARCASVGRSLGRLDEDELAAYRARDAAIVFQSDNLWPALSAQENVATGLRLAGLADAEEAAQAALEQFGLGDRGSHRASALSGGEQQRVAIAAASRAPRAAGAGRRADRRARRGERAAGARGAARAALDGRGRHALRAGRRPRSTV